MTAKLAKAALFLVSMIFFAVLALNIAIPGVVLGTMALANWFILSSGERVFYRGAGA